MKKQRKFLLAGAAVVGVVVYLMVTGIQEAAVYFVTPAELLAKVQADPTYADQGLKVGGRVVPGSITYNTRTLELQFQVVDIVNGTTAFPVKYTGPLPDTFKEGADVVVEGRLVGTQVNGEGSFEGGAFEATTVLTKCGSRYEAGAEDYLS